MPPREIRPGIRRLFRLPPRGPDAVDAEMDEEIRLHLELRAEQLVARGLAPDAARAEAERRFRRTAPSLTEARARLHHSARRREDRMRRLAWLAALWQDVRVGWRALRQAPVFTAIAVCSLALGIGANTAVFTLVNAVMLRALPVRDPDGLVVLRMTGGGPIFTNPLWERIRETPGTFAGLLAYGDAQLDLGTGGTARPVRAAFVSGSYFPVLGVRATDGRALLPSDDVRGCPPVAVVSHGFWTGAMGSDPSAVGRTLRVRGQAIEVVGVLEPRFHGLDVGRETQLYLPLCADAALSGSESFLDQRSFWLLRILARPLPGLSPQTVDARLAAASPAIFQATLPTGWAAEHQRDYLGRTLAAERALESLSGLRAEYARALLVLQAITAVVLLVACANVGNLMLARAAAREREFAVRVALGGGRGRLVRQLLTEGGLLAAAGALLGLALAYLGSRGLVRLLSTSQEMLALSLAPDARVLAFTASVAVGTVLLFALAPAWRAARVDPQRALTTRGGMGRRRAARSARVGLGQGLVVAQVALSLVLVTGAALLLGSFGRIVTRDPGFRAGGVLTVRANLNLPPGDARRAATLRTALVEALRTTPGVRHAAAVFLPPVSGGGAWTERVLPDGATTATPDSMPIYLNGVTTDYFATLGMAFVTGRDFAAGDGPTAPRVAVVNETFARRVLGAGRPVGRTFRMPVGDGFGDPFEVVGVVRDARYGTLDERPRPVAYVLLAQDSLAPPASTFLLRMDGEGDAAAARRTIAGVQRTFATLAPQATLRIAALERDVAESLTRERLLASLSAAFGGLALVLAMGGLYGLMAYTVGRRRGEIGVRLALGASPTRVRRAILGQTGALVAAGVAFGVAAALASGRVLEAFLHGVSPRDPATLLASAALLAVVAMLAGDAPARRAARVDPAEALRQE